MIVQLTGTLVSVTPSVAVLDVNGVGYELGISASTAAALPQAGEAGVTVLTRMVVREDSMELFGFASREERALFDRLRAISGVGPKLALSVLSTFTPQQLAVIVATNDGNRLKSVSGLGKKKAERLVIELSDVFAKDAELKQLVGLTSPADFAAIPKPAVASVESEAIEALLGMGFTSQEAMLALEGYEEAGAITIEAAIGYAQQSGIPYGIGFIKNKYIGRTFIAPGQKNREDKVRIKLNVVKDTVDGKRVVLVDDSIVRGTTIARIIGLLREAGAKEIHVRSSAPPFTDPCYYGTDVSSKENLIACQHSLDEIASVVGADSVGYLDVNHLNMLIGSQKNTGYCYSCFTGDYPTKTPDGDEKFIFEKHISDNEEHI